MKDDLRQQQPRERWRPRFTIRGMLIAMTIFAGLLAWRLHRAHQQREAVKAIRAAGGWVYYDYQNFDSRTGFDPKARSWQPAWLPEPLGTDFWHEVHALNMAFHEEPGQRLDNRQAPVNISDQLAHLPHLKFLALTEGSVDDAGMREVARLKDLEVLQYWDAKGITDAGASCLRDMPQLRSVHLGASQIGDAGLRSLAQLKGLERLTLAQGNNITDDGLQALAGHPALETLWLGGTDDRPSSITDAGVVHLSTIPNLKKLELQRAQVTVEGLKPLSRFGKLRDLYLYGSKADDQEAVFAIFPYCRIHANNRAR